MQYHMQSIYSLPSHVFRISSQHPPPCQPQRVFPPPLPTMMRAPGYTSRSVRLMTCGQEYRSQVLVRLSSDQQLALLTFDIFLQLEQPEIAAEAEDKTSRNRNLPVILCHECPCFHSSAQHYELMSKGRLLQ